MEDFVFDSVVQAGRALNERHLNADQNIECTVPPVHLVIGFFDAVHRGHQALMQLAIQGARSNKGISVVLTFHPHPAEVLQKKKNYLLILERKLRNHLMRLIKIDIIIDELFTLEYSRTSASDFIKSICQNFPSLQCIYIGEDFRFGFKGEGNLALLRTFSGHQESSFDVISVGDIKLGARRISSTWIREILMQDVNLKFCHKLLGYPYFVCGPLIKAVSDNMMPCLTLQLANQLLTRSGYYKVCIHKIESKNITASSLHNAFLKLPTKAIAAFIPNNLSTKKSSNYSLLSLQLFCNKEPLVTSTCSTETLPLKDFDDGDIVVVSFIDYLCAPDAYFNEDPAILNYFQYYEVSELFAPFI